jgi:cytochrome c-type biogenesis protein CcmH/NrfG
VSTSRPQRPRARKSFLGRQAASLRRTDRLKVIGGVLAFLIACLMIAVGLEPVLMDWSSQQQDPPPLATTAPDEPSQYEQELRAAIEEQPENPQPVVSLANLLMAQNRGDEAVQLYERAVELDPERLQTRLDFGYALTRRGSFADAEIQFQRAISINPESADAHYLLGELYLAWQPQRLSDARAAFAEAIAVQPGSVAAEQAAMALAEIDQALASPVASPAASPVAGENGS